MRVLLLNPPGRRRFLRDYYCSSVSKAGYLWQPIDLLVQSGFLATQGEVHLLDAIARGWDVRRSLAAIDALRPDVIFALVGGQSSTEDLTFLRSAQAAAGGARLAVSGEPVLVDPERLWDEASWLHAVVVDFTTPELAAWVASGQRGRVILGQGRNGRLSLPRPEHSLFQSPAYRLPFDGRRGVASVLGSLGCPSGCAYCNSGRRTVGYRTRELEEVQEELIWLLREGQAGHIYFRDMDFTAQRERALALSAWLAGRGLSFSCYSRPDALDDELCAALARAGCRLVQLGVESRQSALLASFGRHQSEVEVRRAFHACRQHGLRVGAHFVLGLPGESEADVRRSLAWAIELAPDFASFNLFRARTGSLLRERCSDISRPRLERLRRRAQLAFYGAPSTWLRLTRGLRSPGEALDLARSGWELVRYALSGDPPD